MAFHFLIPANEPKPKENKNKNPRVLPTLYEAIHNLSLATHWPSVLALPIPPYSLQAALACLILLNIPNILLPQGLQHLLVTARIIDPRYPLLAT